MYGVFKFHCFKRKTKHMFYSYENELISLQDNTKYAGVNGEG